MHRRKEFVVYPPDYDPYVGRRYLAYKSLRKANLQARKFGAGSEIVEYVQEYRGPRQFWWSSSPGRSWTLV